MTKITIREPSIHDKAEFISAIQNSQTLHEPWVTAPQTADEFEHYLSRAQGEHYKSYIALNEHNKIIGVFNLSEIVRGLFQNAYLGFYATKEYAAKGYMSAALKLVLEKAFNELGLHRLEANIQPENSKSIQLVKKNGFRYEGYSPRYLKINNRWCGHERWAITSEDFMLNAEETQKNDHIEIVPYQANWPVEAQREIANIRARFPKNSIIDIQHVGSTAIPGLSAKPILDIQIAARSLDEMKVIGVHILQKIGYEYWADNPDPERMFFVKGMPPYGEKRTHHVHIVEPSSKHWEGKILFRDYLISHPDIAKEYEALKIQLAAKHTYEREDYTDAKAAFVQTILQSAKSFAENTVMHELKSREPIFHHPERFGITKEDIENQMCDEFWEVGASGTVYTKQDVIETLLDQYNNPEYQDIWEAQDFELAKISENNYLLTYVLIQDNIRVTRRATLWRRVADNWKVVYHQGTLVK